MTSEQFEREKKYRTAITLAKNMLDSGVISSEDFEIMRARFIELYRPVLV